LEGIKVMNDKQLFIDILSPSLISIAEEHIKNNLLHSFYEEINNDEDLDADRKWAGLSDVEEIRIAFNQFYNLTSEDSEYLS
jgi:hypothetical protein